MMDMAKGLVQTDTSLMSILLLKVLFSLSLFIFALAGFYNNKSRRRRRIRKGEKERDVIMKMILLYSTERTEQPQTNGGNYG